MIVQLHNKLSQPRIIEATRVVVFDEHENPLAVVIEYDNFGAGRKQFIYGTYDKPQELEQILRSLGINKTVIVESVDHQPLSDVIWTPP